MKVTKIKAFPSLERKKNVAAYARVSSGKDAMLHSLSSQVSYYSKYIQSHNDWEYVGVYADEAMTGTKDNRREFQKMLKDMVSPYYCKNSAKKCKDVLKQIDLTNILLKRFVDIK